MTSPEPILTRRKFLIAGLLAGTGLLIGLHVSDTGRPDAFNTDDNASAPNAWITLLPDNTITVNVHHSEMGQGIATALAMIVTEELDAEWSQLRFVHAPVADIYKNPMFDMQWTVSSRSVETSWDVLREAGATVRQMLLQAAAATWQVAIDECTSISGQVVHQSSGRRLTYGELARKALSMPLPEHVPVRQPQDFRLIGTSPQRLDGLDKITGKAVFGMDVRMPHMLIATVMHGDLGAQPDTVNREDLLSLPGVIDVRIIETGVAIIGKTFWQVSQAMNTARVSWRLPDARPDSERLFARWAGRGMKQGKIMYEVGDPVILDQAERTERAADRRVLDAVYDLPYQAHATPEPMNCTAVVDKNSCTIWAPTQNQQGAREIAARLTGLPLQAITIHTTYLGGGFGRRAMVDYVGEAVELSQIMQAPVQVIWTREEDLRHDYYRPATHNRMRAVLDASGTIQAWRQRIVGADVFAQVIPDLIATRLPKWTPQGLKNLTTSLAHSTLHGRIAGKKAILGAAPLPYGLPNMRVEFDHDDPGVPLGWWRSVAHSSNCFAVESFLDEIAVATNQDPVQLRLQLLQGCPRLHRVLELVASATPWHMAPPPGIHRGLACHDFQDTMMAMVAEISLRPGRELRVQRIVCAVDCGQAVNPGIIEAQVQSGVCFGLTAALKSAITIRDGQVQESNFDDFQLLRFDEMPQVETHIVSSLRPPTGMGEVPVPLVAPALANAIFAATGKRLRTLPFRMKALSASGAPANSLKPDRHGSSVTPFSAQGKFQMT